eukprot:sb/3475031/
MKLMSGRRRYEISKTIRGSHSGLTAGKVVTWCITQLKYRITELGPELEPKVETGPNSLKVVLTLAVRESHIEHFGPNYAGTGPNFGPKCFVKDPQGYRLCTTDGPNSIGLTHFSLLSNKERTRTVVRALA